MIQTLKGRSVLEGFRGKPLADIDALADTIVQLARMAVDLKGVLSALDLNPLMVLPEGQGVVAADILMECAPVSAQKE
jgi:succinyl-CoA synthetase beta subunit